MTEGSPERALVKLATAGAIFGLALQIVFDGAAFYAIAAWIVIVPILLWPQAAIPALLGYLAVQEPIAAHVHAVSPQAYGALRSFDELAMVAAVLRLGCLRSRGKLQWLRWKDWRWAAAFVLTGIVSSALHGSGLAPAALGLFLSCRFFGYVLLAWSVPWNESQGVSLLRVFTCAGPVMLGIGFVGFLFPDATEALLPNDVGEDEFIRSGLRPFRAPFLNPGVFGWVCAVAALAAISVWLVSRRRRIGIAALSSVFGILLSLRRKPLLGLPLALIAALGHLDRRQKAYLLTGAIVVGAVGSYWGAEYVRALVEDTAANYLDPATRDETARGALVAASAIVARQYVPFGAGFGRFGSYPSVLYYSSVYEDLGISGIYGFSEEHPYYLLDLYWPHLLGEVGVLGVVFMGLWFVAVWRRLRAASEALAENTVLRPLAMFATMMLAEALAESVGAPIFETPLPALAIALPIGMALRLADEAARSRTPDELAVPNFEDQQRIQLPLSVPPSGDMLP
jgi:hypothetical protein